MLAKQFDFKTNQPIEKLIPPIFRKQQKRSHSAFSGQESSTATTPLTCERIIEIDPHPKKTIVRLKKPAISARDNLKHGN